MDGGVCSCVAGWKGRACDVISCPGTPECSGRGRCVNGQCTCAVGWAGLSCSISTCIAALGDIPCSGHGTCSNGTCICDPTHTTADCSIKMCPTDASGNLCSNSGICLATGECSCQPNATGIACGTKRCPRDCSGNGVCLDGVCLCDPNFAYDDCSIFVDVSKKIPEPPLPLMDHSHAKALRGAYLLVAHLESGADDLSCPSNLIRTTCAPHRIPTCQRLDVEPANIESCEVGCVCDDGLVYDHLEGSCVTPATCQPLPSLSCSPACVNGECNSNRECSCLAGWTGSACEISRCPVTDDGECSGHGGCVDGKCICDHGFTGTACEQLTCFQNCTGRGECVRGMCQCLLGFTGSACQFRACPIGSNGEMCSGVSQGICNATAGRCACRGQHYGLSCSNVRCPNDCSRRGDCDTVTGECLCDNGWKGLDCSQPECPNDCSLRGECDSRGQCHCYHGFAGLDCSILSCPTGPVFSSLNTNETKFEECSGAGKCVHGKCFCRATFSGPSCSERYCPKNCTHHGKCVNGICQCNPGRTGADCSRIVCEDGCNGKGICSKTGECVCQPGWRGAQCFERECPGMPPCNSRGECISSACICADGFGGPSCEFELPKVPLRVVFSNSSLSTAAPFTPCVFPFVFRNRTFDDCTTEGSMPSAWCGVGDGLEVAPSSLWGLCAPSGTCGGVGGKECSGHGQCLKIADNRGRTHALCQCAEGFTGDFCDSRVVRVVIATNSSRFSNGQRCHFPFVYNDRVYHDCTTEFSTDGREWCALTRNYASDQWGVCAPRGTCPGVQECSGHGHCNHRIGKCECVPGFEGSDCSKHVTRVTTGEKVLPAGQLCAFPFAIDGVEYSNCTNAPTFQGPAWCALKSGKFDAEKTPWDYCAPIAKCPGSPECSERGECVKGKCVCKLGFHGVDCNQTMTERDVLEAIYKSTEGSAWINQSLWLSGSEHHCNWFGVTCDSEKLVAHLALPANDLHGTIDPSISLLTKLTDLDLSANNLIGTIPSVIGTLSNLKSLNLANNRLVGNIPEQILDLDAITRVSVSENFLTGGKSKVEMSLERLLHSSFTCDYNCIDYPTCSRRSAGCDSGRPSRTPFSAVAEYSESSESESEAESVVVAESRKEYSRAKKKARRVSLLQVPKAQKTGSTDVGVGVGVVAFLESSMDSSSSIGSLSVVLILCTALLALLPL